MTGILGRADRGILERAAGPSSPATDLVVVALTKASDYTVLWIVTAAALALVGGRRGRRAALRGLLSMSATSALVNGVVKPLVRRGRPPRGRQPRLTHLLHRPTSGSFPSGHTASGFAFTVGASIERPALAAPLGVAASTLAYGRLRQRVHHPSDVVAGALLGALVATGTRRVWPVAPGSAARTRPAATGEVRADGLAAGEGLMVVVNRSAGPALSDDGADVLRDSLPKAEVVECDDAGLAEALEVAAARGAAVGVCGGDGTVNAAAAVILPRGLPLVVVPAGTLNHLARDLGIESPGDTLAAVRAGRLGAIDVGLIAGRPFLNTASFGSYPELVDVRQKLEPRIGKWPAMLVALVRVLRRAKPVRVEIEGVERRIWMIFIGNCRYHPSGFAPSWRSRLDDGTLDVRIVDAAEPWSRARLVAAVLTGRLGRCRVYEQRLVTELQVRSPDGPLRLARDGETFDGPAEFTVGKAPQRVSVFVPSA